MGKFRVCAVSGCRDRDSPRHQFPNPEKDEIRFHQWISACANQKLLNLDPKLVFKSYRVCHQHFAIEDRTTNMYIKKTSVPSLLLPNRDVTVEHVPSTCGTEDDITPSRQQIDVSHLSATESDAQHEIPLTSEGLEILSTPTTSKNNQPLLKSVNVRRQSELSPKAKRLYKTAIRLKNKLAVYRGRTATFKNRLRAAQNHVVTCNNGLRSEAINFCLSQLQRRRTKAKGHRFTLDEKLMSLALFKHSGSGYRFLSKLFCLPSRRTLLRLLSKITVHEGVNEFLMESLKKSVGNLKKRDRLCTLIFDEIALKPSVSFNKHNDELVGTAKGLIFDHALVFMVRGICKKWKQIICYVFCKGSTAAIEIKRLIVSLIRELQIVGLEVVATVCDQGATNTSAIESMVKEARAHFLKNNEEPKRRILIDDIEVIPLYDVPHLIKGIRNNLLEKDLVWGHDGKQIKASWRDIEAAYYLDTASGDIRVLPKISEFHVNKLKIKKMKVSYATQVFSHSMAAAISIMARHNERNATGSIIMPNRAQETAKIVKFFDVLFDSVNGGTYRGSPLKPLKAAVSATSNHHDYWKKTVLELKHMYFQKQGSASTCRPPSLKNWTSTLEGFLDLREILLNKKNLKKFLPILCSR